MTTILDGLENPGPRANFWDRHASPVALLILGSLLLFAAFGGAGGQPSPRTTAQFGLAEMHVKMPAVIRNGEFFEAVVDIEAGAPLTDATLAVEADLWRYTTLNPMIPAATEEKFVDGDFRLSYGPLEAGEILRIKIDGQINPPLFAGNSGAIALYDGERLIGTRRFDVRVLP